VRFGNVLGSQGSVMPRFAAQIDAGGPLEVTHPDMERYFMSSAEAVGLILSVTALESEQGAYFMDMGAPVSILELGRGLIAGSGKDIDIEFTGLRPGEKLSEQLTDEYDRIAPSSLPNVFRITPTGLDAYLTSADVAHLEAVARTMENAIVRQRVFGQPDERLGRTERAVGQWPSNAQSASACSPTSRRFRIPPSSGRSMTKLAPTTVAPSPSISFTAASAVPPVAIRSSMISTFSPAASASSCISTESTPYSSWYSWRSVRHGSLPFFRTGAKPTAS